MIRPHLGNRFEITSYANADETETQGVHQMRTGLENTAHNQVDTNRVATADQLSETGTSEHHYANDSPVDRPSHLSRIL